MNRVESQRAHRQLVRRPNPDRLTRPKDVSSDEEEEDNIFDPLMIMKSSNEGLMVGKWLSVARTRLGGNFPRPDALKQMNQYAERIRRKELLNQSQYKNTSEYHEKLVITNADREIAQHWLHLAKTKRLTKLYNLGTNIRNELKGLVNCLSPENDWFYTAEFRAEGKSLVEESEKIFADRQNVNEKNQVKIDKLCKDYREFDKDIRNSLLQERKKFDSQFQTERSKIKEDLDERLREFNQKLALLETEKLVQSTKIGIKSNQVSKEIKKTKELMAIKVNESNNKKDILEAEIKAQSMVYDQEELSSLKVLEVEQKKGRDEVLYLQNEINQKNTRSEIRWQAASRQWIAAASRKKEKLQKKL